MNVTEMFIAVSVANMKRAVAFYVQAFGATATHESSHWSSLHIAGVRLGLSLNEEHAGERSGLHFAVDNLSASLQAIEAAGGKTKMKPTNLGGGVVIASALDTEGNEVMLRGP
jgi:predicted enzyme related to lactoylglutathione lyase